jgi:DNA-binding NarL/FixJ family response regulator
VTRPIRVLVVDDQPLFREGVLMLLGADPDLLVVGEAEDGAAAVEAARALAPDVVLMDLRMPGLDGLHATELILAERPDTKILVLTTFGDEGSVFPALRAGAIGYLLKDASSSDLRRAVRDAAAGESPLQPSVATKVVAELARRMGQDPHPIAARAPELLSEREREVLRWIARGASNKQIGAQLFIAEGTVKNHVTHIFTKLGVDDRVQAALRARELGIV